MKNSLNVDITSDRVKFVYLTKRRWVEADMYPLFTLLGQVLGSMWLGLEALSMINPGKAHFRLD